MKCVTEYTQNFEIKLSFGTSSLLHFSCKNEKKLSNKEKTKQPCLIEQHINYWKLVVTSKGKLGPVCKVESYSFWWPD